MRLLPSIGAAVALGLANLGPAHARRGGHGPLDDQTVNVLQWVGLGLLTVFVLVWLWGVLSRRTKAPSNEAEARRRAEQRTQRRADR
jgi:hypothetical protein